MKTKQSEIPLTHHCPIEIYRNGKFSGKGFYLRRASLGIPGNSGYSVILNERGLIDSIPTSNIKAVGGAQ